MFISEAVLFMKVLAPGGPGEAGGAPRGKVAQELRVDEAEMSRGDPVTRVSRS